MANTNTITTTGSLFKPELVKEMFSKVKGHSTLAKLCASVPIAFAGNDYFTFSMDGEVSVVGEGAAKPAGKAKVDPVTVKPVKLVYQHRVTDEFMRMSEEKQLPILQEFSEGFSKKIARGIDICAFLGLNPAENAASATIGTNCFDRQVTASVTFDADAPDDCIDDAVALIQAADGAVTGIAMAPAFGAALGKMKNAMGNAIYPEFRFGGNPAAFSSIPCDVNSTVSFGGALHRAIVGDFANALKWGYAEEIPLEIIPYGDPDGQGDLKRQNQIVLRAEAYVGWGILDPSSFALIKAEQS